MLLVSMFVVSGCEKITIDPASMDLDRAPGVKEKREAQEALRQQYASQARVVEINKAAFLERGDGQDKPLAAADFIPVQSVVRSEGPLTELYLFDGSSLRLGDGARLQLDEIAIDTERTKRTLVLTVLSGTVWFRVAKARALKESAFTVRAGPLRIEVEKARFNVRVPIPDATGLQAPARVGVFGGTVRVVHAAQADKPVELRPDRQLVAGEKELGPVLGMSKKPGGSFPDSWTLLNLRLDKSVGMMENYLTAKVVSFTYVTSIHAQQKKLQQQSNKTTPPAADVDSKEEMPDILP